MAAYSPAPSASSSSSSSSSSASPPSSPSLPLNDDDVARLKWRGVPSSESFQDEVLRALIVNHQQGHKPNHHPTCLKSAKAMLCGLCRAKLPAVECPTTSVGLIYGCPEHGRASDDVAGEASSSSSDVLRVYQVQYEERKCPDCDLQTGLLGLTISLRRDAASAWIAQFNQSISVCFGCNNNCQYVKNSLVSLYAGMYGTKPLVKTQNPWTLRCQMYFEHWLGSKTTPPCSAKLARTLTISGRGCAC